MNRPISLRWVTQPCSFQEMIGAWCSAGRVTLVPVRSFVYVAESLLTRTDQSAALPSSTTRLFSALASS